MQKKEIDKIFETFNNYMTASRLKDAIEILQLAAPGSSGFLDELEQIKDTYCNMLKYKYLGILDPQQVKIYHGLKLSLYEVSDRIKQKLFEINRMNNLYPKPESEHSSEHIADLVRELFGSYTFDSELRVVFPESEIEDRKSGEDKDYRKTLLISVLFEWLWFGDKLTESDKELIVKILQSGKFEWYEKCLIISAVTMGLLRCFDVYRFEILFTAYDFSQFQISQRAFTGLLLGLFLYDHRLFLYPQLLNRLKVMQGEEFFESNAKSVIFQLMKAKDTEKVTKKFRDEIMPDIVKFAPRLEDKLGLNQIVSDDPSADKNPRWKQLLEDSPDLMSKLEEVTRMQLEGMDVFMSTFANLKHYPFFSEISNWFIPFHLHHKAVEKVLKGEDKNFRDVFMDGLNRSQYMCNSDKYSFCMSLGSMPSQQKEMMIQMFTAEMEGMKDMEKEEDILDSRKKSNNIYTQYIQDLYRFFKLYPYRQELDDVFKQRFDFHNKEFMQYIIAGNASWRSLADFYFDREYYAEALEIYQDINAKGDNSQVVFEKIAYSLEKLNQLEKALSYYRKAELFDENRAWTLRKIARILWMLKKHEESIAVYREAETLDPENLHLQITIGNCYLHIKDYDRALHYYYKVELASPDNLKVLRPVAWCLFVSGKLLESRHYYEKLMGYEPNKYDYMNLGHVFLCMKETKSAIECYLQSLKQKDNSIKQFMDGFIDDTVYLNLNGVKSDEIPILADYIKYRFEQNISDR